jgi:hypothetical protein
LDPVIFSFFFFVVVLGLSEVFEEGWLAASGGEAARRRVRIPDIFFHTIKIFVRGDSAESGAQLIHKSAVIL